MKSKFRIGNVVSTRSYSKKGIYYFDYKLGDEKETTMIINLKDCLNDDVSYHHFPFPISGILKSLMRDIRLGILLN